MLRVRGWLDGLGSWFPRRPGCDVRSPSGSTYRRPKARHPAHAVHSATPRFAPSTRPSGDAEDRRLMLSGRATEPGEPERTVFSPCRYRRATPSGDAKAYRYAPRVHCLLRASSSREDEGGWRATTDRPDRPSRGYVLTNRISGKINYLTQIILKKLLFNLYILNYVSIEQIFFRNK